MDSPPSLMSARQAAVRLGFNVSTAERRAQRAYARRDPGIMKVAGVWLANEDWWRALFALHPRHGRPPKNR